ncbi:histidine phosphatase superfamily [Polychytrium aggregatum]|uniref:histidine phosphatase superfamily n=1 Tax=Polychytrium aggregatum TaxID=110093 RepID=UPI0022FED8EE|nr:histidine phosphatase superfamily [Polychytrium aggregatum]KAI9204442.1 histidine phosphatase superfamily [Polychytrium aggregatum]
MSLLADELPQQLRNRYFVLRHGHSLANQAGIIQSDPDRGTQGFGLSELGKSQANDKTRRFLGVNEGWFCSSPGLHNSDGNDGDDGKACKWSRLWIFSSDFKRAFETAEIVRDVYPGPCELTTTPLLRERFFGYGLEGQPNTRYDQVWAFDGQRLPVPRFSDEERAEHPDDAVESPVSVRNRVLGLISQIERADTERTGPRNIVLVAHGDTLQILQTAFARIEPWDHRSLRHLDTAEWRQLVLSES